MEGYKYKQNEKGIPVPMIDGEGGASDNEGLVPRSVRMLFD